MLLIIFYATYYTSVLLYKFLVVTSLALIFILPSTVIFTLLNSHLRDVYYFFPQYYSLEIVMVTL